MSHPLRTLVAALGLVALGATTTLSADALARPGGEAHQRHRGAKIPGAGLARAMASIDLTAEQEAALSAIHADVRAELEAGRAQHRAERDAWKARVESGEIDRAEVHARIDAESARRAELAHATIDRILDVYDSLSEDQLAELSALMDEHEAKMEEHEERRERHQRIRSGDHMPATR